MASNSAAAGPAAAGGHLRSAGVGRHEVVWLHGQPGSGADWQQVAGLLPPALNVVALDRPGYGASRQPAGGFAYGARAVLAELDARGIGQAVHDVFEGDYDPLKYPAQIVTHHGRKVAWFLDKAAARLVETQ